MSDAAADLNATIAAFAAQPEAAGPCDAELAAMAAAWAAVFAWQQQGVAMLQAANAASQKAWDCLQKHAGAGGFQRTTELDRAVTMTRQATIAVDLATRRFVASTDADELCITSGIEHIKRLVPRGKPKQKVSEGL